MTNRPMLRNVTLVAALAAVTATAWAASESLSESTWVPHMRVATQDEVTMAEEKAAYNEPLPANDALPSDDALASNERVMPIEAVAMPAEPASAPQPRITVEQRRLTTDQRIQAQLMDVIAQAPNMSGQIGVESNNAVVTLSGWTATSGQARRAVRYAYAIEGVRDVQSEIRPRVGGSI